MSVTPSGSVIYTPVAGYSGTDTFTYSEKDNQGATSNVATVSVVVTASAPGSGSGGGGAADLLDLLALAGLVVVRRLSRINKLLGKGPRGEGDVDWNREKLVQ